MTSQPIGGLTDLEGTQLKMLLGKLGQPWDRELNELLLGHLPASTIELVVLRNNATEVLLTWREPEAGDPWPEVLHLPGTVIRIKDGGKEGALHRLARSELGCGLLTWQKRFDHDHEGGGRPLTLQNVYTATIAPAANKKGEWYPVEDLPDDLLELHVRLIRAAVLMVKNS